MRRGSVPILAAVALSAVLFVGTLAINAFSRLAQKRIREDLAIVEAFNASEISSWYVYLRKKGGAVVTPGRQIAAFANDVAGNLTLVTAQTYLTSSPPGTAYNVKTTLQLGAPPTYIGRFVASNYHASLSSVTAGDTYCGELGYVGSEPRYRACLYEKKSDESGNWVWVAGSSTSSYQSVVGTKGVAAAGNLPGGNYVGSVAFDASGALWLYGGVTRDVAGTLDMSEQFWKLENGQWAWIAGSAVNGTSSQNYGTKGVAAPTNYPGVRYNSAMKWSGSTLYLFGGANYKGDLWRYSGGVWTWLKGTSAGNFPGVYGTQGVAAASNNPGGRHEWPSSWVDTSGNFWVFGGVGFDSAGTQDYRNDLWKFDGTNWTWMRGGDVGRRVPTYGTQGVAQTTNTPGGRNGSAVWKDNAGTVWLFGGAGYDSNTDFVYLDDLWTFNGTNWTWIAGHQTGQNSGNFGTKGTAASSNYPSGRANPCTWYDASTGTLWMFGGYGADSMGNSFRYLNDLWKFDGTQWTWMKGEKEIPGGTNAGIKGVYGTQGQAAPTNTPGGRTNPVCYTDSQKRFYVLGGFGYHATALGNLGDVWRYTPP